jgi:hypothetical protein
MSKIVRKVVVGAVGRPVRWIGKRLRPGAGLVLRGACTSAGSTAVTLLVMVQARY